MKTSIIIAALAAGCGGAAVSTPDPCRNAEAALACPNAQRCVAGACVPIELRDQIAVMAELLPLENAQIGAFAASYGSGSVMSATFRAVGGSDWFVVNATLPGSAESWVRARGMLHGATCEVIEGRGASWVAVPGARWQLTADVSCNDTVSPLLGQEWSIEAEGHITN